ncbi:MAG: hypothetical protein IKM00_10300 [Clostridia bacterium]|nr:hypothetical protein [Clostridia bacterium]
MIDEEQYIAKGDYRRPQIGNFILVKQYLFLRRNGKKVLLLRFFNELGHTVDGMDYTVFQYDAGGKPLARARVSHGDMQFLPGEFYAPGTAVEVEEACADFSVVFSEVRSDRYRYRVTDGGVSVFYVRRPPSEARARKEKKSEGGWRAALAALITVALLTALAVGQMAISDAVGNQTGLRRGREAYTALTENAQARIITAGERNVEI